MKNYKLKILLLLLVNELSVFDFVISAIDLLTKIVRWLIVCLSLLELPKRESNLFLFSSQLCFLGTSMIFVLF